MKGKIGITHEILDEYINEGRYYCEKPEYAYCKYTSILPHKQIYSPICTKQDSAYVYNFKLQFDNSKFLVLNMLLLFVDDIEIAKYYKDILNIDHTLISSENCVLNKLDGESLLTLNKLSNYMNLYMLQIPIMSKYFTSTMKTSYMSINLTSSIEHTYKLLGIYNHIASEFEIKQFDHCSSYKCLNTSFLLNVVYFDKKITLKNNIDKIELCHSIIIITDKKDNVTGSFSSEKYNTRINLKETKNVSLNEKVIFIIDNNANYYQNSLMSYQPIGNINIKDSKFVFKSKTNNKCEIKIIYQAFNVLTIFKD